MTSLCSRVCKHQIIHKATPLSQQSAWSLQIATSIFFSVFVCIYGLTHTLYHPNEIYNITECNKQEHEQEQERLRTKMYDLPGVVCWYMMMSWTGAVDGTGAANLTDESCKREDKPNITVLPVITLKIFSGKNF